MTTDNALTDCENIRQVLNNYARGCDRRDWKLLDTVFTADVQFNYGGEYSATGSDKLVKLVRNSLGGCGPTQHLLGNFFIQVNGDSATCSCYVRAFHVGLGEHKGQLYEVWGGYDDQLLRTNKAAGNNPWQICQRKMWITYEHGSRAVLKPGE